MLSLWFNSMQVVSSSYIILQSNVKLKYVHIWICLVPSNDNRQATCLASLMSENKTW
jgi:hypothetical protein